MCQCIRDGKDFSEDERVEKHKEWFERFCHNYDFTPENTEEILKKEIGKTFQRVLEDAGVYARNEAGKQAFLRFVNGVC